jgi:hypothetical protein
MNNQIFKELGMRNQFKRRLESKSGNFAAAVIATVGRASALMLLLLGCASEAQAVIPTSERTMLVDLYNSTGGASWNNKVQWNGAAGTECSWYGVSCDGAETHVTAIGLSDNNLVGAFPSFSALTYLDNLDVSKNQLTGSISSLAGLTSLAYIFINNNQLSGTIPSLGALKSLQYFYVNDNQFSGSVPSLSGLTSLQYFYINNNRLSGSLPSLGGLTSLAFFYAGNNQLSGSIPSFGSGLNLYYFDVGNNQLSGPVPAAPSSLTAAGSSLCGNRLVTSGNSTIDADWTTAAGNWLACQTSSAVPGCTLSASPASIAAGSFSTLTATCSPAATSYAWSSNTGFGSSVASGTVSPTLTTTYTVMGSNAGGAGSAASATVTVSSGTSITAQALFVNASTSLNKTSVLRLINPTASAGTLTVSAFDENGAQLGAANTGLGVIGANQTLTFTSANLEPLLGFTPNAPTAKYSVYFYTSLSAFQIINYTSDIATGALTLSQSLTSDRSSASTADSVTRSAWFVSSSTSANKTNVLRIINTSNRSGTLTASLYDENGNLFGSGNTSLGAIASRQMFSYTSAQLENALGYTPPSPTAKYRVVFTANLPALELINFTKDIATGNLALVQAQIDDRPVSGATTSTRNVLLVNPSNSINRNTVLRIVNPNATAASVTATAYNEAGNAVGAGSLGSIGANAILALTSAQIETAMAYAASSVEAKYRLAINASVPGIEVINDSKLPTNGNLYLAQAQTDNRASSSSGTATRNAYIIYPSGSSTNTTELRIINTTAAGAALTASAYDDSGTLIGTGRAMGTLGANQMLTFTSAQLESLFGYTPASNTGKWRIVFSAALNNFELVNYARDGTSGLLVLAQPQTE